MRKGTKVFGRIDHSLEIKRQEANTQVLKSGKFKGACDRAGIEPTRRQASKWNRKKGLAYQHRNWS